MGKGVWVGIFSDNMMTFRSNPQCGDMEALPTSHLLQNQARDLTNVEYDKFYYCMFFSSAKDRQ